MSKEVLMKYNSLEKDIEFLKQGLPPQPNDGFLGSNINPDEASLILLPVPWEATVSFGEGTAAAPDAIRLASHQLDLESFYYKNPYTTGIAMLDIDSDIEKLSQNARERAKIAIEALENSATDSESIEFVNSASNELNRFVYDNSMELLKNNKLVGLVGGDHSSPLGFIKALNDNSDESFGILHLDAHHDLRKAYEGFSYSHASIFYNVLHECEKVSHLVQIGIRDYSLEEKERLISLGEKGFCLYDSDFQRQKALGKSIDEIFSQYIEKLPNRIYLSVDIDALEPLNCPNTGTPVPGGLSYSELEYLIYKLAISGKTIIGFDLCEVGTSNNGWDENVGARVLYQLCGAILANQGKIEFNR